MFVLKTFLIFVVVFVVQGQRFYDYKVFSKFHEKSTSNSDDFSFKPNCERIRANVRQPFPFDQTKYFLCRSPTKFEIIQCSNGGIFDNNIKACIDLCEQKKPCLNNGQCIILPDLTLQCVCRRDWTGERCETAVSTCAFHPCGPNAECQMLNTTDYSQDYVCLCDKDKFYGRNCEQTVPNPCLANLGQFHPFAYSRRAYINCDRERIFFQPCYGQLYWNQEEKRCDLEVPTLADPNTLNLMQQRKIASQKSISPSKFYSNSKDENFDQEIFQKYSRFIDWQGEPKSSE